MREREIFICDCKSLSHQAIFWLDEDDNQCYITIHLTTNKNFFKRCLYGLKYIFGYKSNFGAWDEFLFEQKDLEKLRKYLEQNS